MKVGRIGITTLETGRKPTQQHQKRKAKEFKFVEKRPGLFILDIEKGQLVTVKDVIPGRKEGLGNKFTIEGGEGEFLKSSFLITHKAIEAMTGVKHPL